MSKIFHCTNEEPFRYHHHVKGKAKRRRYNHHLSPSFNFMDEVKVAASVQFKKRFSFRKESSWIQPEASAVFVKSQTQDINNELFQSKIELNDVKNSLSDKEIRQWHTHTTSLHCGGKTMQHLRQLYHVELCTQAWCKFHEILSFYPIIPSTVEISQHLNSVHLCEAPGAFVTSLNHFCKSRPEYTYIDWQWIGTTLNPYYEGNSLGNMIADDRFIQETLPHWFFGLDNSGDLMQIQNLEALRTRTQQEMDEVHLVTADGSINCQNDPGEQETFVSQLHYCEIITALCILADGGSFVIKMFTMFESCTANMMFLLNLSFEEVHVYKPSTSKAGNSEVYVICLKYKGRSSLEHYLPPLLQAFSPVKPDCPLLPSLPSSFISQLTECCNFFKSHQMETITNNLKLYQNMTDEDWQYAEDIRDCCTYMFVEKCRIQMIQRKHKIVTRKPAMTTGTKTGMFGKTLEQKLEGTFNERVQKQQLSWHEKMLRLKQKISKLEEQLYGASTVSQLQNTRELSEKDVTYWGEICGREIQQIINSPFCSYQVLNNWIEAHENFKATEKMSEEFIITQEIASCLVSSLKGLSEIPRNSKITCLCSTSTSELSPVLKILRDNGCIMVSKTECTEVEEGDGMKHTVNDQNQLASSKSKVHIFCSCDSLQLQDNDKSSKIQLLDSVLSALKSIFIRGCLILQVNNLLTRFNAGLLYILYKVFNTVYLCDFPTKSSVKSSCLLICECYSGCHGSLLRYLENLHHSMLSKTDQTILQILPMSELYAEQEFEHQLTHFNETSLMRQVVAIVNYEMTNDRGDESSQESGTR